MKNTEIVNSCNVWPWGGIHIFSYKLLLVIRISMENENSIKIL